MFFVSYIESIQFRKGRKNKTAKLRAFPCPGHDVISAAAVSNNRTLHYRRIIPANELKLTKG